MKQDISIWEIEEKYLRGLPLTKEEVECATSALASSNLKERVLGCEALLQTECSPKTIDKVFETLRDLCLTAIQHSSAFDYTTLPIVLSSIPLKTLQTVPFRDFVYFSAKCGIPEVRTNNVLLLKRLAKENDYKSVELLKLSCDDENEAVRHNAIRCLNDIDL